MVWFLLLQVILILSNAIFAGTEIAMISADPLKLEQLAHQGDRRAARVIAILQNASRFFATIQVAITLSGFLGAAFASDSFTALVSALLQKVGVPLSGTSLDHLSVVLVTFVISYCSIVCGEMVPKRLAMAHAEAFAMAMSGTITVLAKLFAPLVWLLTHSSSLILRWFHMSATPTEEDAVTMKDVLELAETGKRKGTISTADYTKLVQTFSEESA